ncbi:unnamed protein product, partial [marine sediment metagenome]
DWIESFLKYEVTADKGAQGPGEIEGRIEKTNIFVFDALMMYLPRIAAAMRGSQADAVVAKNKSIAATKAVGELGRTLIGMEESFRDVTRFALYLKKTGLLEQLEEAVSMIDHTKAIEVPVEELQEGTRQ